MAGKITRSREELTADLLDQDQRYRALVENCSPDQLLWHAPGSWSITDCIQHVSLANSQYLAPIRQAIAASKSSADLLTTLSTAGWFSSYFVGNVVSAEKKKRFSAPKKIRPTAAQPDKAIERLLATHAEIRTLLASTNLPDLNKIRFKNPFVSVIRFTVATGVLIMAAHGRRHLLQAEAIRDTAGPRIPAAAS